MIGLVVALTVSGLILALGSIILARRVLRLEQEAVEARRELYSMTEQRNFLMLGVERLGHRVHITEEQIGPTRKQIVRITRSAHV